MIESLCLYLLCLSAALLCYTGFQNQSLIRSTSCSCSTCCFGLGFQLQNLQDFIKISRTLIKDIFLKLFLKDKLLVPENRMEALIDHWHNAQLMHPGRDKMQQDLEWRFKFPPGYYAILGK